MNARRPATKVTPLIDVLLVLLVMFMATLPLSEQPLETKRLPEPRSAADAPAPSTIVVEYEADGRLSINQEAVLLDGLSDRLTEIFRDRRDKTIFIMGDPALPYRRIVAVMDAARGAGVTRVGIVTEKMRAMRRAN